MNKEREKKANDKWQIELRMFKKKKIEKSQFLCLEQTLDERAGDEKAIRVQIK